MGRFNKRLAAAKLVKNEKKGLSTSAVVKTLAKKEQEQPLISSKSNKIESLPEKPTKKSILKMNTTSKVTKKDNLFGLDFVYVFVTLNLGIFARIFENFLI